jgi:glutamate-1-semialdehyde 2,1-aminomutase
MGVLAEQGLFERQRELGRTLMSELRKLTAEAACRSSSKGWARFSRSGSASGRSGTGGKRSATRTRSCSPGGGRRCCSAECLFHPSQYENLFLSLVHTADDVADMLTAAQEAFAVVARRRSRDWSRRP